MSNKKSSKKRQSRREREVLKMMRCCGDIAGKLLKTRVTQLHFAISKEAAIERCFRQRILVLCHIIILFTQVKNIYRLCVIFW